VNLRSLLPYTADDQFKPLAVMLPYSIISSQGETEFAGPSRAQKMI
jgi:hypothetical protein